MVEKEQQVPKISEYMLGVLREIDAVDPEAFPPPSGDPGPGEREIGVINNEFTRKAFALWRFYRQEKALAKVRTEHNPDDASLKRHFYELDQKDDLLQKIVWHSVRCELDSYGNSLRIRGGWRVVELDERLVTLSKLLDSI